MEFKDQDIRQMRKELNQLLASLCINGTMPQAEAVQERKSADIIDFAAFRKQR